MGLRSVAICFLSADESGPKKEGKAKPSVKVRTCLQASVSFLAHCCVCAPAPQTYRIREFLVKWAKKSHWKNSWVSEVRVSGSRISTSGA